MQNDSYLPGEVKVNGLYESEKTISSHAFNEARELKDLNYLSDLYISLENNSDDSVRQSIYFVIGHILRNTFSEKDTKRLISALNTEKDNFTKVFILNRLEEIYKPTTLDLKPIFDLNNSRNWHVRCSSYLALTNTEKSNEDYLNQLILTKEKEDDIVYILRALGFIGTKKSLPSVEKYLKDRKAKIKYEANIVLATIMLRESQNVSEIIKKTNHPESFVIRLKERLDVLTRL